MLFKVLDKNGRSCNGGCLADGSPLQWSLPTQNADGSWTPGEWMSAIEGELVPCKNGYHLAEDVQVLEWLNEAIYEAECRGERIDADNKVVVREARLARRLNWNDRIARLFAVWCAREALRLINNPDPRSIAACDTAERFANGAATKKELVASQATAGAAAWATARAAAKDAAGAATWDVAWATARAAARAAAWDAARNAQYQKFLELAVQTGGTQTPVE